MLNSYYRYQFINSIIEKSGAAGREHPRFFNLRTLPEERRKQTRKPRALQNTREKGGPLCTCPRAPHERRIALMGGLIESPFRQLPHSALLIGACVCAAPISR
ncbi:hypothetical protein CEXT_51591 [Caerostris extrusa]|uniref:Uncharacterized protein n=1 Tax=Caerostris extrusa TaxID=172846 RepID=A0AAV4N588_CAEEX|nr:hypothetical protein CEXT_51591 [Caerostris extrusa]